ncbi:MAG: phosphate acetyltransferase [Candidatus Omnitrophica bacterium]|nr:phosphate acetyltransferase [Candidatus Omnitrophota bacterium]MBU1090598.1 phosphate acetyltransferase [Candidatus Omnitrophota bacterium]MBU1906134.1 phosphate acetyltransferase [Candidatus Omnitrophota bacterium]
MDIIKTLHKKAAISRKTIVLPEPEDKRVQEASRIIEEEGIANVILLTKDRIVSADKEKYIQEFYEMRKHKGIEFDAVEKMFEDPLYYAAMMTREGKVDGFVAGASHTTADVARTSIWCLGVSVRTNIACGSFIMIVPNSRYGENGALILSDCAVVVDPNSRQLANIALMSAELSSKVLNITPRIALLSYSTKGSAKSKAITKIHEALDLIKEKDSTILVDGEIQADAAIVPEVAKIKCPECKLGGRANILIFPSLESGNISYKLVQRLANARAIGPLILGLNKPCSDLSRGCSVEDIVDCVAVTAIRAQ